MTNKTKLVTVTPRVAMLTERDVGKTHQLRWPEGGRQLQYNHRPHRDCRPYRAERCR